MRTTLPTSDAVWQHPLAQHVQRALSRFSGQQRFVVACSGGRDSVVLADLLAHYCVGRLRLLHINHQLQVESGDWAQQVHDWAAARGVACTICTVQVAEGNLEAQARHARYQAFAAHVQPDEVLVLAHHQQDQAETLLMRLFSGAGVQGLSAMRALDQRDGLRLWRPLLECPRAWIDAFAQLRGWSVVEDPANHVSQYDRVYLRQSVWPVLQQRWPSVERTVGRTALLMQDAAEILAELVAQDLQLCQSEHGLDVLRLRQLSAPRQRQLIAYWMQGGEVYAPPRHRVLAVLQLAEQTGMGQVSWQRWSFRYYQGQLYRLPLQTAAVNGQAAPSNAGTADAVSANCESPNRVELIELQLGQTLQLPSGLWQVESVPDGLPLALLTQPLCVRPRVGGERLHLEGRIGHWPLKKFLQQLSLPVWQRDQVQLLSVATDPTATVLAVLTPKGCFVTAAMVQPDQPSWRLTLQSGE